MKPTLIVHGNCQAGILYYALGAIPKIAERWDLVSMLSFVHPVDGPGKLPPEDIGRCAILLDQGGPGRPAAFPYSDRLPADCRTIRFPPLATNLLWPFNMIDPRNQPEPDFPYGRYPYGDRIVVELFNEGLRGEALWEAYQTRRIERLRTLERLATLEASQLAYWDAGCSIAMTPVVHAHFRERRLFLTPNHPSGYLMGTLCGHLANAVLDSGSDHMEQCLGYFERWEPWAEFTLPVDPQIASRLGLAWYDSEARVRYGGSDLSFEEYMRRYIDFV